MSFLDYLSPVVGGVSSVVGLIQDGQARQRALQQQQQALQDYGSSMDRQYQNILGHNSQTLMGAAGQGGTALTNMGANLGAANAGAGVYNSSATAGALAQGQANTQMSLADLAARNQYNANSFYNQGQSDIAHMRLGQANTNYGNANADLQGSRQGLGQFIGALGQSNLLGQQQPAAYDPAYSQQQVGTVGDADLFTHQPGQSGSPGGLGLFGQAGSTFDGSRSSMGSLGQYNLSALGANSYRPTLPQVNGTINQGVNLGGNAGGLGNGGQGQGGSSPFYGAQHPFAAASTRSPYAVIGGR